MKLESIGTENFDSKEVVEQVNEPDQKLAAMTPDVVRSFQGHRRPIEGAPRRVLGPEVPQTTPEDAEISYFDLYSDSD